VFLGSGAKHQDGYTEIMHAFEKSGIEFSKYDINGCVKLRKPYASKEDMEYLAEDILNSVEPEYELGKIAYEEKNEKMTVEANIPGGSLNITISCEKSSHNESNIMAAVLDITRYEDLRNINDIGERVFNCLSSLGPQPSVNLCITGYEEGRIPESRKDCVIEEMMSCLKGNNVDGIDSNGLTSICAYSEYIPYFIKYRNQRVNFNIASRYSSFDDRTYFWIGTPIISIEY
jgi:hypothetical protein